MQYYDCYCCIYLKMIRTLDSPKHFDWAKVSIHILIRRNSLLTPAVCQTYFENLVDLILQVSPSHFVTNERLRRRSPMRP